MELITTYRLANARRNCRMGNNGLRAPSTPLHAIHIRNFVWYLQLVLFLDICYETFVVLWKISFNFLLNVKRVCKTSDLLLYFLSLPYTVDNYFLEALFLFTFVPTWIGHPSVFYRFSFISFLIIGYDIYNILPSIFKLKIHLSKTIYTRQS